MWGKTIIIRLKELLCVLYNRQEMHLGRGICTLCLSPCCAQWKKKTIFLRCRCSFSYWPFWKIDFVCVRFSFHLLLPNRAHAYSQYTHIVSITLRLLSAVCVKWVDQKSESPLLLSAIPIYTQFQNAHIVHGVSLFSPPLSLSLHFSNKDYICCSVIFKRCNKHTTIYHTYTHERSCGSMHFGMCMWHVCT